MDDCQAEMRGLGRLFTEGDTKCKESSVRGSNLSANDFWRFPHLVPDLNCFGIHIKQPDLLATLSPETVNADCPQERALSGFEQVRSHTDRRRIFDVLHVLRTLLNDPIVQSCRRVFRDEAAQEIIRRGTGILQDAHSGPRRENE